MANIVDYRITFDSLISRARAQAREIDQTLGVKLSTLELQLRTNGEVCRAARIMQYGDPDHKIEDDDSGHFALEEVIIQACLAINELKYANTTHFTL